MKGSSPGDSLPPDLFVAHRRVEFVDTDMAGIVHFSRFFIFMETAEHQLREALGFPVHHPGGDGEAGVPIGWPRVAAHCDYHRPARFGDDLAIHIGLADQGRSSLTFTFAFRRRDDGEGHAEGGRPGEPTLLATGRITSVCCRLEPKVAPVPIPEALVEALGAASRAD